MKKKSTNTIGHAIYKEFIDYTALHIEKRKNMSYYYYYYYILCFIIKSKFQFLQNTHLFTSYLEKLGAAYEIEAQLVHQKL